MGYILNSFVRFVKLLFHQDRVNLLSVGESQKIPCHGFAQIVFS